MNKTAFGAGVEQSFRRGMQRFGAPLAGAVGGMLMSTAVAPEGDRFRYLPEGAVIGGLLGHAKFKHARRRWHGVIG